MMSLLPERVDRMLLLGAHCDDIATGAGGLKTAAQRASMGGIANTPFDSCYHNECDTIENINQVGLEEMSAAAAFVTAKLAESTVVW